MQLEQIIGLSIFAIISSITPGPNNMMLLASGINYGFKRSLPHLAGICIGFPVMIFATGLGLYTLFIQYPYLQTILKYIGAAYLLILAWKLANTKPMKNDVLNGDAPLTFLEAAAFQWVNPKAWVMALSALTTFMPQDHELQDVLLVAIIFGVLSIPCVGVWNIFGVGMKRYMNNEHTLKIFNISMALLLAASTITVVV
jgi:threonine/homoserine/homoserine lactone efflux protein